MLFLFYHAHYFATQIQIYGFTLSLVTWEECYRINMRFIKNAFC